MTTKTADLLDDIADAVGVVLEKHEIPHDPSGAKYTAMTLLHLAAIVVTDDVSLPPEDHSLLSKFFLATARKDEAVSDDMATQLLGDHLVIVTPIGPAIDSI